MFASIFALCYICMSLFRLSVYYYKIIIETIVRLVGIICFVLCLITSACVGTGQAFSDEKGDTLNFKYAENIEIVRYDDYTVVTLDDPWNAGHSLATYVLIDRNDSSRITSVPQGVVIYTPVRKSVVFTSPHCQLLQWIGAGDIIKGVCDLRYMNIPTIKKCVAEGCIADCGDGMSPNVEKIIELTPDVILSSPYENKKELLPTKDVIPVIACADYMETSSLGRAEWMKFYGLLFGHEHEADSLFHVVDSCYNSLKTIAKSASSTPAVLTERKTGSVWYCPGGRSSMALLLSDANGHYAFADDSHSGSLALSPEQVLDRAGDADVWLFMYNNSNDFSKSALINEYGGYANIKAYRNGNVFGCNCLIKPYFEEMSFHPDFVLRDLVQVIHPELKTGELRYYKKIILY